MAIPETKSTPSAAPARPAKKAERVQPKKQSAPKARPAAPAGDRATVSKPEKGKAPSGLLGGLNSNFAAPKGSQPNVSAAKPAEPAKAGGVDPTAGANIVGEDQKSDPNRRKVIVADDFKSKDQDVDGDGQKDATHGDVIANGLQSQGFQTSKVDLPFLREGDLGPGQAVNAIADKVKDGTLSTKPGDVVNMSFGAENDPSFKEASDTLGFHGDKALTPQNIKERRGEVQARIAELGSKPDASKQVQDWLSTQTGIQRLQDQGLKVVHAAGNDGPDRFSPGFLGADHQLSATDAKGRMLGASAQHSLTTPAQGLFNNSRTPSGGIDINGDGKPEFERSQLTGGVPRVEQLKAGKLGPVQLDDQGALRRVGEKERIQGRDEAYVIKEQPFMFIDRDGPVRADPDGSGRPAVQATYGTSFSVLDFLPKNLPAQLQ